MSWQDHLKSRTEYYKKQNENKESESSDLSKGIVYCNTIPNKTLSFFLLPHPKTGSISVTRGIHWMAKGKANVRCPIFTREDQQYLPNPDEGENVIDAIRRAFDDDIRCAWDELLLAAWDTDNDKVKDGTFSGGPGNDRSVSLRHDFFILPYDKIYKEPPKCFGDKPDWNDTECKECIWNKECYLGGKPCVNVLEKPSSVEQKILARLMEFLEEMGEEDDPLSFDNAILFKLSHVLKKGNKTEYDVTISQKRFNIRKDYEEFWDDDLDGMIEETWPSDKAFFAESHTYAEMVSDMKPHEKKCLFSYLKSVGKEAPGIDLDDAIGKTKRVSDPVEDDEDDDESPRRRRRGKIEDRPRRREKDEDEEETEERKPRRKSSDSDDDDEDDETKERDTKTFRTRSRRPSKEEVVEEEDDETESEEEESETEEEEPRTRVRRRRRV